MPIPKKIVLTGGPCAGKTTVLAYLVDKLSNLGFMPVIVPEGATELINAGLGPKVLGSMWFQRALLNYLDIREVFYTNLAESILHDRVVMIFDRAAMDAAAYTESHEFELLLSAGTGHTIPSIRDRYDRVIFLHSVAVGKPELYTRATNTARTEITVEEAVAVNTRTLAAWTGCEKMTIIGNEMDMNKKMDKVFRAVSKCLGIPTPIEIQEKFLFTELFAPAEIPQPNQRVAIKQHYLANPDLYAGAERIRARSQDGGTTYFHTIHGSPQRGIRTVDERIISKEEYVALLGHQRDPRFDVIEKERICFVYKNQYFTLDFFTNPERIHATVLVEIKLTEENQEVELPPFMVGKVTEVTDDHHYTNTHLAYKR